MESQDSTRTENRSLRVPPSLARRLKRLSLITSGSKGRNSAISFHKTLSDESMEGDAVTGFSAYLRASWGFHNFVYFTILCSAVQMGIQAEFRDTESWVGWVVFENVFTLIFAVEMVLWIVALRLEYFKETWNILDFVIAWVSIISSWIFPMSGFSTAGNFGTVKVFRLLRLFRVLRIMKVVPELRMVIEGMAASIGALFWIFVMLIVTIYTFSIFCVEIVGTARDVYPGYNETGVRDSLAMRSFNNFEFFGDLKRSMMSLFSIVILAEWDALRPIWEFQRECIPVFIVLIFVTSFGVVNVIIGVIVERTNESMQHLKDKDRQDRLEEQMQMIQTLADLVWIADSDGNGQISREEMRRIARKPDILSKITVMAFPKGFTFDDIFTMMNIDGNGELTKYEFLSGMHRLLFSDDFQDKCMMHLGMGHIKDLHTSLIEQQEGIFEQLVATLRRDIESSAKFVIREVLAGTYPIDIDDGAQETCGQHGLQAGCLGSGSEPIDDAHGPTRARKGHRGRSTKSVTIASRKSTSRVDEGDAGICSEPRSSSILNLDSASEEASEGEFRHSIIPMRRPWKGRGEGVGTPPKDRSELPALETNDVKLVEALGVEPTSGQWLCSQAPWRFATEIAQPSSRVPLEDSGRWA